MRRINIVHRDIAARNIMLTSEYDIKLIDFGLAREIKDDQTDSNYETKHPNIALPIPYMAPECLKKSTFNHKSDIWALGVFMWEIFTFCRFKYSMYHRESKVYRNSRKREDLTAALEKGLRLKQPEGMDPNLYKVIKRCWFLEKDERISAADFMAEMDKFLNEPEKYQ